MKKQNNITSENKKKLIKKKTNHTCHFNSSYHSISCLCLGESDSNVKIIFCNTLPRKKRTEYNNHVLTFTSIAIITMRVAE